MRALSGLMLLLVFTVLLRCGSSKPQKETPRLDVRGALDKVPLDGGVTTATLEWLRDDAGVHVDGVAVSLDADAPEGAHIRITVLDDDGGVLSKDTLVAFCVKQARKGERLVLPLDSQVRAEDNPLLQQRYEEMQEEEQRLLLSEQLAVLNAEYEDMEATMRKRSEQWIDNVRSIANKLNKSFHLYMEKLGFQGEVALRETGRLIDYEMQLRVAFHSGSAMVDLSGQRHSGGERAVSTVMYLMALQDMTSAPFRVVDEINQGMDPINER